LPYRNQERGKAGDVVQAWEKGSPRTLTMSPGDVLYIPRGWLHETSTVDPKRGGEDEISMHATMALAADEVSSTWWQMLWCSAINSVWGSEGGRTVMSSGSLDQDAAADVMDPKGSYYQAARENTTFGASLRRAIPLGFLMPDHSTDGLVTAIESDMERLASDPDGLVRAIKPLLDRNHYEHAAIHFARSHSAVVKRYMDAYLGFLGEPTDATGSDVHYGDKGGMHLDQAQKQQKAEEIIQQLNLDTYSDLMKGCMGEGAAYMNQAEEEDDDGSYLDEDDL